MNKIKNHPELLLEWKYSRKEWDDFVTLEKANKKEDNIYFGFGILVLGTIGLMLFRSTSFFTGLLFAAPLAILIPFLRMKFSYKHLKKGVEKPYLKIYNNFLIVNNTKIEVANKNKRIRSLKIVPTKNNLNLLEVDIQWLTRKGPTNDEFRFLIPKNKLTEAKKLVTLFYKEV